jgi:integrase
MKTKRILDQLPALDRTVYPSKNAGTFRVYDERWVLSYSAPKGLKIPDLNELPPAQKEALLRTLAQRATKFNSGTIITDVAALKKFIKEVSQWEGLSEEGIDVNNLLTWFITSKANPEAKRNFRRLILDAMKLGYEAAFEDGVSTIAEQYESKRLRLHPDRFEGSRSLTEYERKQLYYQLARENKLGHIPDSVRVPTTITLVTGKRPSQLAHSKFKDFSMEEVSFGVGDHRTIIKYNVPVAKQKGQGFRTQFNAMPIVSSFEIWDDVEAMRAANTRRINQLLSVELTEEQTLELPLFLPYTDDEFVERFESAKETGVSLNEFLRSDRLHVRAYFISSRLIDLNNYVTIVSEFTGRPLRMNAKRFRHTLATNLILRGHSVDEIAEALDHSSRESVRSYVDNLPARAVKIGKQVDKTLGIIARSFNGITVENGGREINFFTKGGPENVGRCGLEPFCKENFPIACYECELFTPNPFGNHGAVQAYVEEELHKAIEQGDSRHIENWHTILLAVLERRYVADQQRLAMLEEAPEMMNLEYSREVSGE